MSEMCVRIVCQMDLEKRPFLRDVFFLRVLGANVLNAFNTFELKGYLLLTQQYLHRLSHLPVQTVRQIFRTTNDRQTTGARSSKNLYLSTKTCKSRRKKSRFTYLNKNTQPLNILLLARILAEPDKANNSSDGADKRPNS